MINLKIDPEFQSQIPPLTDDEFKQLEENILKEGKRRKTHVQHQCRMITFFDTLGFACPKVLGNIRRNCITDGHEDQGKNILHPHRRRISCKSLCPERIYHCLYNHHTDRNGRLLQNRGHCDPKHRAQTAPVKSLKRALVSPHPAKKDHK